MLQKEGVLFKIFFRKELNLLMMSFRNSYCLAGESNCLFASPALE